MQVLVTRLASRSLALLALAALLLSSLAVSAQEKPEPIAPHARLVAARSIYIEHAGARLPNDVIDDAFRGWGRYLVVADPAHADLIVSIKAPVYDSGISQISLFVLDAHDRVVLWSGGEQPRSSMKEKQREDNIVEASLRLFRRFRNLIEPEP